MQLRAAAIVNSIDSAILLPESLFGWCGIKTRSCTSRIPRPKLWGHGHTPEAQAVSGYRAVDGTDWQSQAHGIGCCPRADLKRLVTVLRDKSMNHTERHSVRHLRLGVLHSQCQTVRFSSRFLRNPDRKDRTVLTRRLTTSHANGRAMPVQNLAAHPKAQPGAAFAFRTNKGLK